MQAQLKSYYFHNESTGFYPEDPECFSVQLRLLIGPEGGEGEESYDIQVLSVNWLKQNLAEDDVLLGKNKVILQSWNEPKLIQTLSGYISRTSGKNWQEITFKLAGLGAWEFDGYVESAP